MLTHCGQSQLTRFNGKMGKRGNMRKVTALFSSLIATGSERALCTIHHRSINLSCGSFPNRVIKWNKELKWLCLFAMVVTLSHMLH